MDRRARVRPDSTEPSFYQYWINLPDADVVPWLRWFTLMDRQQIDGLARQHEAQPHRRLAQIGLARHMTALVHGPDELKRVETATAALFGAGDLLPGATILLRRGKKHLHATKWE